MQYEYRHGEIVAIDAEGEQTRIVHWGPHALAVKGTKVLPADKTEAVLDQFYADCIDGTSSDDDADEVQEAALAALAEEEERDPAAQETDPPAGEETDPPSE